MPRSTLETEIRSRIEAFAAELATVVQQAALESVQAVLSSDGPVPARFAPGRPRGSTTRRKSGGKRRGARGRGRPPSAATDVFLPKVLAHVRVNPGQSISEIAAALGATTDQVRSAAFRLLRDKQLRTTGRKRGTKYHLTGSGGGVSPGHATRKARKPTRKSNRKPAARPAGRETRRASGTAVEVVRSTPLPIKAIIPAQQAAKSSKVLAPSLERQEPGPASPPFSADTPEPGSVTVEDARSKGKKRGGRKAAAMSTAHELAEVVSRKK